MPDFTIATPLPGSTVRVVATTDGGMYFTAGGRAFGPHARPSVGVLRRHGDPCIRDLVFGHLYRRPAAPDWQWAMWFDVRGLDLDWTYDLIVCQVSPRDGIWTRLEPVCQALRFEVYREPHATAPKTGSWSAGAILPYGTYTTPDTTVTKVELRKTGLLETDPPLAVVTFSPAPSGGSWTGYISGGVPGAPHYHCFWRMWGDVTGKKDEGDFTVTA